ncbi:Probable DNA-directed RNA polymerase [Babesia bigemina]|uniref:Probable DNA-directed RNA polymerase n=1 Tax=Babesia bigemina TaxID=5866 RepID=A0A061DB44_BABBI|nr:Probable DNA-directed RNA polymerase [Babesia bigemina]CDR97202.1 Probable DNA-directed RNA polymerase [Babesia bigemina]|eukprot:XP_012769388.1 Probable DNA-directed RNA polymerase [Babesia bigemina]
MSRQTSLINRPETADMMELAQGVKKVEWITDSRSPLCGTFIVYLEDHTFGTLMRSRLSKDERVAFVGYRVPHPLENKLEIRLRCKVDSPFTVMLNALSSVRSNVAHLKKVYMVGYCRSCRKDGVDIEDWKVCISPQVEPYITTTHITALDVCKAPVTLSNYNFVVVLGYANGIICLSGVDAQGQFHIVSHNDRNSAQVLHLEVHVDIEADKRGKAALHSFALFEGGTIVRFAWDTLQQISIECGYGINGMHASLAHSVIAQYAPDRMVLRCLDTDSILRTFENIGSDTWEEWALAFHPHRRLLAFAGTNAIRYTSAPRWEIYQFGDGVVHSEPISCLQFTALGDIVVLLTASQDNIAVWDFDTQSVLYRRTGCEFRLCFLTDLRENEVSLAILGHVYDRKPWTLTRLTLPADDRMEEVGVKRLAEASSSSKGADAQVNKRLRRMVDDEAEDAGDDVAEDAGDDVAEDEGGLFDGVDNIDVDAEKPEAPASPSRHRRRNVDVFDVLNDESSIALMEDIERLKRRVAQLERRTEARYNLTPGSCPAPHDESSQWLMYWDDGGQITKQGSGDSTTLHVHLYSGPNAGYIQKHDSHNCHTAALCGRALVTGSELAVDNAPQGLLTVYNLGTNEIWQRRLRHESIASVAVSDEFVAVLGDGVLYIFSFAGSMLGVYRLKGAPVGLAAKGNILAVISECTSNPRSSTVYSTRLLWVNGLRGLARNSLNRVVDLYDDVLVLPPNRHVSWLSISDQLNLWVGDSSGQLMSLVPAMASFHKLGGVSFEWVPSLHLADLGGESSSEEKSNRIRAFPLYVNEQKLCYIRLKEGERYPHSHAPVNFLGYTLRKAPLRIEGASGAYMPFNKFHSVMTRDPKLKEVGPAGIVEDVAAIPWQQYDEMRHSLTLQGAQLELLMQLQQAYGFWFRDAERVTQKAATSMGNVELVHDKWLLRMLRKVKGQRQDSNVLYDVLRMIRYQRCLDTAAEILSDQMDGRQRRVLREASMLLANGPNRDFLFPSRENKAPDANDAQQPRADGEPDAGRGVHDVTVLNRTVVADKDTVPVSVAAPAKAVPPSAAPKPKAPAKPVHGFVEVDGNPEDKSNWMEQVFRP